MPSVSERRQNLHALSGRESTLGDSSLAAYNPHTCGNKKFRSRMLKPSPKSRRPFAIVMLIMVVWQCWFVAVEASEQFHLPTEPDSHHLVTNETESQPNCANSDCPSHNNEATTEGEACDHCCACQGHCAHISIHVRAFWLTISPPSNPLVVELPEIFPLHPATIYRPPIV